MKRIIILLSCFFIIITVYGQSDIDTKKTNTHLITNKEYRQFVYWVRDSIAYRLLGVHINEYLIYEDKNGNEINPPLINWNSKINWNGEIEWQVLMEMHLPEHERFYRKEELDTRKLVYNDIKIYPDTTCWIDTSIVVTSYINQNLVKYYNWHPIFNDYPVQGITKEQVKIFLEWKSIIDKKQYKLVNADIPTSNIYKSLSGNVNTEFWKITNKEYKEFVYWVRDSIAYMMILGQYEYDGKGMEKYFILENKYGERIDPPFINWKVKIRWKGKEERELLAEMMLPEHERHLGRKQLDWRKLNYKYYFIDYKSNELDSAAFPYSNLTDRTSKIKRVVTNIYPDTTKWMNQYCASEINIKFYDKKLDKEQITGISYEQAKAFYNWKILKNNSKQINKKISPIGEMIIPTKEQWEEAMSGKEIKPVHFDIPLSGKQYFYQSNIE